MTTTNRKTPFLGFIMAIDSITSNFNDFVVKNDPPRTSPIQNDDQQPMKYLLTYKFSQDHIEHFFGCVRSHGGCNSNPTARQFTAIYKRLLTHHEVKSANSNCTQLEDVPILAGEKNGNNHHQQQSVTTLSIIDNMLRYSIFPEQTKDDDTEYDTMSDYPQLSVFTENAVTYIAGYVARNVGKHQTCSECSTALLGDITKCKSSELVVIKNRGGLKIPSSGTIAVCKAAERCFHQMQYVKPPNCRGFKETVSLRVTEEVMSKREAVFSELYDHMFDTEAYDNHRVQLVKNIAAEYIKIRLHH